MIQNIDEFFASLCFELAKKAEFLTPIMQFLSENDLVKAGGLIAIFYFLWFNSNMRDSIVRIQILNTYIACIIAIIVGRSLALLLPLRDRPVLNQKIQFAFHVDKHEWVSTWSSFPSDHAVLFFSLATGIYLSSRKLGITAYLYVLIFICFPRIYLGLHYTSDIFGGALIGILITRTISIKRISEPVTGIILDFSNKFPGLFYACFFLLTYQITTLFRDSLNLLKFILHIIMNLF